MCSKRSFKCVRIKIQSCFIRFKSISMVIQEVNGSDQAISPVKRKRGQRPKDVIKHVQKSLTPYLSTGRPVRRTKVAGRPSRSSNVVSDV